MADMDESLPKLSGNLPDRVGIRLVFVLDVRVELLERFDRLVVWLSVCHPRRPGVVYVLDRYSTGQTSPNVS
jgi:hypothetical protein